MFPQEQRQGVLSDLNSHYLHQQCVIKLTEITTYLTIGYPVMILPICRQNVPKLLLFKELLIINYELPQNSVNSGAGRD